MFSREFTAKLYTLPSGKGVVWAIAQLSSPESSGHASLRFVSTQHNGL